MQWLRSKGGDGENDSGRAGNVRHDPNYFQPEEIARIWEALEGEPIKWKMMVHLFLTVYGHGIGCRRGEVLGLKWGKVDWENKQIYIDCNLLYRKELGIYEDTPKTKGSIRYIRLSDQTMELLAEYRKWYREEKFKWGDKWEDNDYLFPRENGAPMFPGYVCNWLAEFSKRNGLPHINPHAFRHTQASMLFSNGIDSVSISHRLGHAHVSTTTDIYSHEAKLHWDQGGGGAHQRLCGGCDLETGENEVEGSGGLRQVIIKKGGVST